MSEKGSKITPKRLPKVRKNDAKTCIRKCQKILKKNGGSGRAVRCLNRAVNSIRATQPTNGEGSN